MGKLGVTIIYTRRINRGGRYYERIAYDERGKRKYSTRLWKPKDKVTGKYKSPEEKEKGYQRDLEVKASEYKVRNYVNRKEKQIRKRTPERIRTKGFYESSIKLSIIVQYKKTTPFHYPSRGDGTFLTRSGNHNEREMLKSILMNQYDEFKAWINKFTAGGDIYIYYGWTYRKTFSPTGSFDGDAQYLDYIERRFNGNAPMRTINRFRKYQQKRKISGVKL